MTIQGSPEDLRELLRHVLKQQSIQAIFYAVNFTAEEREYIAQRFDEGSVLLRRLNKDDEAT